MLVEHRPCARNCARPWEYDGRYLVVDRVECLDGGKCKEGKQRRR